MVTVLQHQFLQAEKMVTESKVRARNYRRCVHEWVGSGWCCCEIQGQYLPMKRGSPSSSSSTWELSAGWTVSSQPTTTENRGLFYVSRGKGKGLHWGDRERNMRILIFEHMAVTPRTKQRRHWDTAEDFWACSWAQRAILTWHWYNPCAVGPG